MTEEALVLDTLPLMPHFFYIFLPAFQKKTAPRELVHDALHYSLKLAHLSLVKVVVEVHSYISTFQYTL